MTQTNISINKNRLTDIENGLAVAKGEGGGEEKNWEFRINRLNTYLIIAKANISIS